MHETIKKKTRFFISAIKVRNIKGNLWKLGCELNKKKGIVPYYNYIIQHCCIPMAIFDFFVVIKTSFSVSSVNLHTLYIMHILISFSLSSSFFGNTWTIFYFFFFLIFFEQIWYCNHEILINWFDNKKFRVKKFNFP